MNQNLPITAFRQQIVKTIAANAVTIVVADTGAGKSTQVPQYLLAEDYRLVVTQPRRLAVETVSARVAEEWGEVLGMTVGFKTARNQKYSSETRCLFVTDGLQMVREIMGYRRHQVLVIDEVHEWNMSIETLVAWAKRQIESGQPFKLVLMSATIEADKLSQYFNGAPVIEVPGRIYPVMEQEFTFDLVRDVQQLLQDGRNVLVFQPGKTEIGDTIEKLRELGVQAELLPLHAEMTSEEQGLCFRRYGRPKCIVATNVAQTSITVPDIDAVVDSGMERRLETINGVEGLYLKPISLADSRQRKGRAGRTKPGIYIDHCPKSDRPDYPVAEILRVRLDQTVLRLAVAGLDAEELAFFHQPDHSAIHNAKQSLKALGCLSEDGQVTEVGHRVSRLPISVKYGRMVVEAEKRGVLEDVVTIAALMEQKGIVDRTDPMWHRHTARESESDPLAQLNVYRAAEEMSNDQRVKAGIRVKAYWNVVETEKTIWRALRGLVDVTKPQGTRLDVLKSIAAGMVDHVYQVEGVYCRNGDNIPRELSNESVVLASRPEWLVGVPFDLNIKARFGTRMLHLVGMATKIEPSWLEEIAPHLYRRETGLSPKYDPSLDGIVATALTYFRDQLIAEEVEVVPNHPNAPRLIAQWLARRLV